MYWTDWGGDRTVSRANLDGTSVEVIVTGESEPTGIALDTVAGKIYWTDYADNDIKRSNLDGTGLETLATGLSSPIGIALDIEP